MIEYYLFKKIRNYIDKVFEDANEEDFSLDDYISLQQTLLETLVVVEYEDDDPDPGEESDEEDLSTSALESTLESQDFRSTVVPKIYKTGVKK